MQSEFLKWGPEQYATATPAGTRPRQAGHVPLPLTTARPGGQNNPVTANLREGGTGSQRQTSAGPLWASVSPPRLFYFLLPHPSPSLASARQLYPKKVHGCDLLEVPSGPSHSLIRHTVMSVQGAAQWPVQGHRAGERQSQDLAPGQTALLGHSPLQPGPSLHGTPEPRRSRCFLTEARHKETRAGSDTALPPAFGPPRVHPVTPQGSLLIYNQTHLP